jgi:hypothetical protein
MFTEVCPCKDCKPPKRNATCHTTCEEYLKWHEAQQEYAEFIAASRHAETDIGAIEITRRARRRKIWEQLK